MRYIIVTVSLCRHGEKLDGIVAKNRSIARSIGYHEGERDYRFFKTNRQSCHPKKAAFSRPRGTLKIISRGSLAQRGTQV